jgi:amidohydrolase
MNLQQQIKAKANEIFPELVGIRRHLHANPELSNLEFETARYISSKLTEWNINHKINVAGTGIVALIQSSTNGKCVALRADMDALPILEENKVEYRSLNQGVMHACGHDAHMASLLGTAFILNSLIDSFEGSFKLLFQPSEEVFPGGAIKMIEAGVLDNPRVDAIVGQHVLPQLSVGKVGMKSGQYMASTDEIFLTVAGKGGHGATPELNIDPVVVAAHILIALQQISSRFANPAVPTVLSFGRFVADGRTNIIPDKVVLEGTLRTFDELWRRKAHNLIQDISNGIASSFGATCEVRINHGYPYVYNDEKTTDIAREAAVEFLGSKNVEDLPLRMTAEDFSYFSQQVPGVYYRLGIGNDGPLTNLHTATFSLDENALLTGCSTMAAIALSLLEKINAE